MTETAKPPLRVEIADAGGTVVGVPARIAEILRGQGIEASVVSMDAVVRTTADAVVLRGDAPGALSVLRALRDDGERPDTPVLLLGTPEGTGPFQEGPGFGAEHVLAKDANAERIAAVLRKITHREPPPDSLKERKVEHTMELAARGEPGEWRTHGGAGEPPRAPPPPPEDPPQVSEIVPSPELSVVLDSDSREAGRRRASVAGERHDSVVPGSSPGGTGISQSGVSSSGTGSVPSTSQLFVIASISDELRKLLFDADRRVFPDRPPIDVSLPRGEDAARDLVPDEFVEAFSLALDEPERADLELTFVGAGAVPRVEDIVRAAAPRPEPTAPPDDPAEERPRTHPGTPTSMSKRPPPDGGETRSAADPLVVPPRPHVRDDVAGARPSNPPPKLALAAAERGELAPLGALALIGQLSIGRLDVALSLRVDERPVVLALARGELVSATGEGWVELRRRALHRALASTLGEGRATEASRGEPTFALERASRLAEESALAEVIARARGTFSIEPRVAEPSPRITRRTLAATVFELARHGVSADRVAAFFLPGPEDPTISRFERLSRLEVTRLPGLERVLDVVEAPRELAWLVRAQTATSSSTVGNLLAAAPDEPGLVGAVFALAQLGGLSIEVLAAAASLAHTDLDARADKAIAALRDRADRADYFEILGISRDADGVSVIDAHYRLRGELLAWPLSDLGLARLEPDRTRILSVLDDAAEVLADPRQRARYRAGLERGLAAERATP